MKKRTPLCDPFRTLGIGLRYMSTLGGGAFYCERSTPVKPQPSCHARINLLCLLPTCNPPTSRLPLSSRLLQGYLTHKKMLAHKTLP